MRDPDIPDVDARIMKKVRKISNIRSCLIENSPQRNSSQDVTCISEIIIIVLPPQSEALLNMELTTHYQGILYGWS